MRSLCRRQLRDKIRMCSDRMGLDLQKTNGHTATYNWVLTKIGIIPPVPQTTKQKAIEVHQNYAHLRQVAFVNKMRERSNIELIVQVLQFLGISRNENVTQDKKILQQKIAMLTDSCGNETLEQLLTEVEKQVQVYDPEAADWKHRALRLMAETLKNSDVCDYI